jgi:hypothetical protein
LTDSHLVGLRDDGHVGQRELQRAHALLLRDQTRHGPALFQVKNKEQKGSDAWDSGEKHTDA